MIAAVELSSRDYWFKVVDMLQQNWALIDPCADGVEVFFVADDSGVFDRMRYASLGEACDALRRNGFSRLAEDREAQRTLLPPRSPFREREHPNGRIYSSGRFWR